jgi:hypothetical protein
MESVLWLIDDDRLFSDTGNCLFKVMGKWERHMSNVEISSLGNNSNVSQIIEGDCIAHILLNYVYLLVTGSYPMAWGFA